MPEARLSGGAQSVRPLLDAAVRQLESDAQRLGRALRAVPSTDADGLTLPVFAAIAQARRNALAWYARIYPVETSEPAKAQALTVLATTGSALGAYYRALRAGNTEAGRRDDRLARQRFETAAAAFLQLDRELGCPYGCKGNK